MTVAAPSRKPMMNVASGIMASKRHVIFRVGFGGGFCGKWRYFSRLRLARSWRGLFRLRNHVTRDFVFSWILALFLNIETALPGAPYAILGVNFASVVFLVDADAFRELRNLEHAVVLKDQIVIYEPLRPGRGKHSHLQRDPNAASFESFIFGSDNFEIVFPFRQKIFVVEFFV